MSTIDSFITSVGSGLYDPFISSIRQIHPDEQPFTMPERHGKSSLYQSTQRNEESTDSTGIVLSDEAKEFLAKLEDKQAHPNQEEVKKPSVQDSYAPPRANYSPEVKLVDKKSGEELAYGELTEEEKEIVEELEKRDAEVRKHEQAHVSAGAGLTSSPKYEYEIGPDGKRYAIGGSVQIETSAVSSDPEATIKKADKIRSAALAADSPSAQDYAVANAASQMKAEASQQKVEEKAEEFSSNSANKDNEINSLTLTKSSEQNSSSMLGAVAFNAVSLHADYNKSMHADTYADKEQAAEIFRNNNNAAPLTSSAVLMIENSAKTNEQPLHSSISDEQRGQNPYHAQFKKYAQNAHSEVNASTFARAV